MSEREKVKGYIRKTSWVEKHRREGGEVKGYTRKKRKKKGKKK